MSIARQPHSVRPEPVEGLSSMRFLSARFDKLNANGTEEALS